MSKDLVGKTYWKGKQINFTSNEKKETIKKKNTEKAKNKRKEIKINIIGNICKD